MAETLAYDFNRDAHLSAEAGMGVPESVERDSRYPCTLDAIEHRPTKVPRVNRRAVRMGEDKVLVLVRCTKRETFLRLFSAKRLDSRGQAAISWPLMFRE